MDGEMNIEQVEVLVEERKVDLDADEESNGDARMKQPAGRHFPEKEENAFEFKVEVEDEHEGGGEEAEAEDDEERGVEDWERQACDREVEEGERRKVGDEGRQARASTVSALSVSGEKILAHRWILGKYEIRRYLQ